MSLIDIRLGMKKGSIFTGFFHGKVRDLWSLVSSPCCCEIAFV